MKWRTCKDCDFYVGNKYTGICTNAEVDEFETAREANEELCEAIKEYIETEEMQDYFRDIENNK